ncbi:hypothetical protein IGI37_002738 [Enterococcus sp. AZ194]|uniref:S66 family peptidase n=1 Tax=Enterococcus sp. AZ194 TaxID=2774629 RepID=UPI003F1F9C80
MLKPNKLKKGDKVAIVSLSSGLLGEPYIRHNLEIGTRRLKEFGLEPIYMPHALKGIDYIANHPEKRAEDLIEAFRDDSIKGIICAIGGDDTYKTLPYLMENKEFIELVKNKPKLFTGFSDTTVNHFMFYKLGLTTYYGMALITDLGEISNQMLSYTEKYFKYYLKDSKNYGKITPSAIWYEERTDFSAKAIGKNRIAHKDHKGYELLQGKSVFEGELLGGCLDSLYDMLTPHFHQDEPVIIERYHLFPTANDWRGKLLFIETSELKESPEVVKEMLLELKRRGLFHQINGIIFGKPQDETFYEEYKEALIKVIDNKNIPIVCNVNFGHATPRCVLPIGIKAQVDVNKQEIKFLENPFSD